MSQDLIFVCKNTILHFRFYHNIPILTPTILKQYWSNNLVLNVIRNVNLLTIKIQLFTTFKYTSSSEHDYFDCTLIYN